MSEKYPVYLQELFDISHGFVQWYKSTTAREWTFELLYLNNFLINPLPESNSYYLTNTVGILLLRICFKLYTTEFQPIKFIIPLSATAVCFRVIWITYQSFFILEWKLDYLSEKSNMNPSGLIQSLIFTVLKYKNRFHDFFPHLMGWHHLAHQISVTVVYFRDKLYSQNPSLLDFFLHLNFVRVITHNKSRLT